MKNIILYTDGACSGNPGPGGWASILRYGDSIKELSGELERQVSVEELSAFMDMPVEEIEDLLKLAGEGTGDGEQTPDNSGNEQ